MAMNRTRRSRKSSNPFTAWTDLAFRATETLAAAAQVIAHRSSRPASAAELYGMGSEKVEAALRASQAMAMQWTALQSASPADFWMSYARLLSSGLAPVRQRAVRNARRYSRRGLPR